jgi:GAF domain-containing protein
MLASREGDQFDQNSLSLLATTAGQIANALEKSSLYSQTDESLRRRVVQLLALTRVSQVLNTTLELERVMRLVHEEVLRTTQAECGAIMLFDYKNGSGPQTRFAVGETSQLALSELELQVIKTGEPQIIEDFASLDLPPPHPEIRSALLAPIAFEETVAGLISLHSMTPGNFDKTALDIVQSLSVQAAIALGNAQRTRNRSEQSRNRRVENLTNLLETSRLTDRAVFGRFDSIAYAIQNASPFDIVLISVYRPQDGCLMRIAGAGIPLAAFEDLKNHLQPWSAIQPLLRSQFQYGNSYLIPHESASVVDSSQVHVVQVMPSVDDAMVLPGAWHPDDFSLSLQRNGSSRSGGVDAP